MTTPAQPLNPLDDFRHTTSLYWWIDTFKRNPDRYSLYRWFVCGHLEDVQYPHWSENGRSFVWFVQSVHEGCGGGRYAFLLREVQS